MTKHSCCCVRKASASDCECRNPLEALRVAFPVTFGTFGQGESGRDPRDWRHFWAFDLFTHVTSASSHRDGASGGRDP